MPTYEYVCKACGHQWEAIQKMSDPAIQVCEKCGAPRAQRLISQGNFILKGSGWYATGGYGASTKPSGDDGGSGGGGGAAVKPATPASGPKPATPATPAGRPPEGGGSGSPGGDGGSSGGGETSSRAA